MKTKSILILSFFILSFFILAQKPKCFSGIYPSLAYYNNESECGTGAVVPWANRLWVITYGPHLPFGSSDKLYEITPELKQIVRSESIGGTPANRMIHRETNQLFIGPYLIDSLRNVRTISVNDMPGRLTGNARHLTDPEHKMYCATMEEGFYEVDVNTLKINTLYADGNLLRKEGQAAQFNDLLPGCHGKGLYSGQGVLVYSNNGEDSKEALSNFNIKSGVLAEWNGKDWKVIRRNQFVEVTGPDGIYGSSHPETDPIWVTGWDSKSVVVGVRDNAAWHFYRLPKASHSYDGAHGWNTEWPRIRNVGTTEKSDYLMTMHGMFWHFPPTFSSNNSTGIRPRSAYLKVIGDFARWNNQLVFGCDDSAQKEFLNTRKVKGNIEGSGQSNSNLWFTTPTKPDELGSTTAEGAVWISDSIKAGECSEPFLFSGWDERAAWIKNEGMETVKFTFEVDEKGNNIWKTLKTVNVISNQSAFCPFIATEKGEWVRVIADKATKATVHFSYSQKDKRMVSPTDSLFAGLSAVCESNSQTGLLWGLGNNRRKLGVLAGTVSDRNFTETGYYELDSAMNLVKNKDTIISKYIRNKFAIPKQVITIDNASVLVVDDRGRRWRLPKGTKKFTNLTNNGVLRICREVSTERDLFNACGTFYELPAENADGFAKIRPIASHNFRIFDYASYRGMLIITGINTDFAFGNSHIITSADGKASVWAGAIDDIWRMGKPVGQGGPWKNSEVKTGVPSDAYLIGFYDKKTLTLSHNSSKTITFTIEVEPIGHGPWMTYKTIRVKSGETFSYEFPANFQSRWIRFGSDADCNATAWLSYE
jgi:hypothetical protein